MSAALSSPTLRIVVGEPVDGVVRVGVAGEVDTASAAELRAVLTAVLAGPGVRGLVVDLTAVTFLAVPGLHPLLEAQATAAATGRSMGVLAGPAGGVDRLLRRAGLGADPAGCGDGDAAPGPDRAGRRARPAAHPARPRGRAGGRPRAVRPAARPRPGRRPRRPGDPVDLTDGLTADRYDPPGAGGATVVFLHGGGWTVGTAAAYGGLAARLAAGLSAVVLAVEFRRAPEHPFPAAVQDAVAAVRWALDHADDPARVVVAGDSGGGNLAAVACRELRDAGAGSPPPSCCSTRRSGPVRSGRRCPRTAGHRSWAGRHGLVHPQYVPEGVELTDPRISPLEDDDGHAGLPPALVATAELDALRDSGRAYAAALATAGVPVTALDLAGVPHGFAHLVALHEGCAGALDRVLTAARGLPVFG